MNDTDATDPFPDPREDPRIIELEQRIAAAQQGFEDLNRLRRDGEPMLNLDSTTIMLARLDALASVLVSNGVIDYIEYTGEHLTREAEQMERALAAAREIKRQASGGIIVPPSARNGNGGG
jgi:hypothetical protein